MARFIRSTLNPRYQASSSEMFALFGLPGQTKWPDQGCPTRFIQGIAVHVLHVDHPSLEKKPGVKSSKHRVIASCPDCGKAMSAGRLHQHKCASLVSPGIPASKAPAFRSQLTQLGRDAVLLEFGAQRQIEADNEFVGLAVSFMTAAQVRAWDDFAHKATVQERIEWAFDLFEMSDEKRDLQRSVDERQ